MDITITNLLSFKGVYSSAITYALGDAVFYSGSSYVSLVEANVGNEPDTSTTQWSLLAQQGSAGATGPQGSVGPTGPQGVQGSTGIQGVQGIDGPTGPQGAIGPQGPQGIQGVPGPQGSGIIQFGSVSIPSGLSIAVNFSTTYTGTNPPTVLLTLQKSSTSLANIGNCGVSSLGTAGAWTGFELYVQVNGNPPLTYNYAVIG